MVKNFDDKNISFVIRGAYYGEHPSNRNSETFLLIRSIEKFFPNALIYYVIWQDYNFKSYLRIQHRKVKIIEINDPKTPELISISNTDHKNNINRQLVCAKEGLSKVNTSYCCIVRSDFLFHNKNLIPLYKRINNHKYYAKYKLFEQPILIPFYGSVNSKKNFLSNSPNYPFHPSDLFHFGLTKDLKDLFDISLMKNEDFNYFLHNPRGYSKKVENYDSGYLCKFLPEQYIFRSFLIKKRVIKRTDFMHMEDRPERYEDISNKLISNSFFVVSFRELGSSWQKKDKRLMRLPKLFFRNRTIFLSSIFFHASRYGFFQRNVSLISKIYLSITNNLQVIFESTIIFIFYIYKFAKAIVFILFKNIPKILKVFNGRFLPKLENTLITVDSKFNNIAPLLKILSKSIDGKFYQHYFEEFKKIIDESGLNNKENLHLIYSILKNEENTYLLKKFITKKKNLLLIKDLLSDKDNLRKLKNTLSQEQSLLKIKTLNYIKKLDRNKNSLKKLKKDLLFYFSKN